MFTDGTIDNGFDWYAYTTRMMKLRTWLIDHQGWVEWKRGNLTGRYAKAKR